MSVLTFNINIRAHHLYLHRPSLSADGRVRLPGRDVVCVGPADGGLHVQCPGPRGARHRDHLLPRLCRLPGAGRQVVCLGEEPGSSAQLCGHQRGLPVRPGHVDPQHHRDGLRVQPRGLGRQTVPASQDCEAGLRPEPGQGQYPPSVRRHAHLLL